MDSLCSASLLMRYFISKSCLEQNCAVIRIVNNGILLKINDSNRDRCKCGFDAVKVEILKQLRKMENINNDFFSDILEQRAITVVIIICTR